MKLTYGARWTLLITSDCIRIRVEFTQYLELKACLGWIINCNSVKLWDRMLPNLGFRFGKILAAQNGLRGPGPGRGRISIPLELGPSLLITYKRPE